MSDFVIIPDVSSDLSKELRERFQIPDYIRGTIYFPDGKEHLSDLDWDLIDPKTYYESMSGRKILYKTASAQHSNVLSVFEPFLKEGKDILAIILSSALSANLQVCKLAAQELMEKYPERKILVVDSLRYSAAEGLLTLLACMKKQEGATLEETAAYIEEKKYTIHQIGSMDDLFFLVKTGRLSNFKAFFGSLMGVNPMADLNRQGLSQVLGKCKGKKKAQEATIEYMRGTIVEPKEQIIFVAHSNREQASQLLAQQIREVFQPKEVIITNVGMSCGASIGPGLCAAFYQGKPVTEGLAEEQALLGRILAEQKK